MWIIKIIKIKCFYPPRTLYEHWSIFVYKFRPERTGFNMYAEYTQQQLTFLALVPCVSVYLFFIQAYLKFFAFATKFLLFLVSWYSTSIVCSFTLNKIFFISNLWISIFCGNKTHFAFIYMNICQNCLLVWYCLDPKNV